MLSAGDGEDTLFLVELGYLIKSGNGTGQPTVKSDYGSRSLLLQEFVVGSNSLGPGSESAKVIFVNDLYIPFFHLTHCGSHTNRAQSGGLVGYVRINIKGRIGRDHDPKPVSVFRYVKHSTSQSMFFIQRNL